MTSDRLDQGGCESWYVDETGRNSTLWPDWTSAHAKVTERFDLGEYEVERARKSSPAAVAV